MGKNSDGNSAFWNLTNTVIIAVVLVVTGLFSYLAISLRANAAEISTFRSKTEVNTALIGVLGRSIPEMRGQLSKIDRRLYRLEVHFKTLPKEAEE